MSAAVPGLPRDMIAFNKETVSQISASLDLFNIMTYDLMNRRDNITKHHTGIDLSMEAVNKYLENGVPPEKAHLGFAFYVKWFKTSPRGGCHLNPIGCETVLMEDPVSGADLGQSGAFAWSDMVPAELSVSFERARMGGRYDSRNGGHYFWDSDQNHMVDMGHTTSDCQEVSSHNREEAPGWRVCLGSGRGQCQLDTS